MSNLVNNTQLTIAVMSYYYTAMAVTIPESFSWNARPVVSGEAGGTEVWFDMNNSNGTFPQPPLPSSLVTAQNSAGTDTYGPEGTTPASSDVAPFTTLGNITFATVTDTAHTSTENCFTFLPSAFVQGRSSEECDCGTTTAALTTKGSTTGCALGNSIFTINQFPTPTISKSTTSTPMVISPKRTCPQRYMTKK